jgi:hypothetical protein
MEITFCQHIRSGEMHSRCVRIAIKEIKVKGKKIKVCNRHYRYHKGLAPKKKEQ